MNVMFTHQAVLGGIEEVVEEVLVPRRGVGGRKGTQPDSKDVHMQERYLSPGAKGWCEAKIYFVCQLGASSGV